MLLSLFPCPGANFLVLFYSQTRHLVTKVSLFFFKATSPAPVNLEQMPVIGF